MACHHCGALLVATTTDQALCLECGVSSSSLAWDSVSYEERVKPQERTETPAQTQPLTFTGSAGEFFRIWIVNIFLTVITLGIYNAWAKVRTRQYFYAHTRLAGHSFDYLANPVNILKGNLVVAVGLGLYYFTGSFAPEWNLLVVGAFYLIFPFLAYQSLRFRTRYSAYRNIRFGFHGTLGESYRMFLGLPMLIPFTFGLLFPYVLSRQKEYAFGNYAFGTTRTDYYGGAGQFYKVYLLAFLGGGALFAFLVSGMESLSSTLVDMTGPVLGSYEATLTATSMVLLYLLIVPLFLMIQEYIFVSITNYCWAETQLGKVSFRSTLEVGALVWLRLSNIIAIAFSLGLLIPWAKVRRTRYIVENLAVVMREGELDAFIADDSSRESSLGEVATDAFDIEIGL